MLYNPISLTMYANEREKGRLCSELSVGATRLLDDGATIVPLLNGL